MLLVLSKMKLDEPICNRKMLQLSTESQSRPVRLVLIWTLSTLALCFLTHFLVCQAYSSAQDSLNESLSSSVAVFYETAPSDADNQPRDSSQVDPANVTTATLPSTTIAPTISATTETSDESSSIGPSRVPCPPSPQPYCLNNGSCWLVGDDRYCECSPGYRGERCNFRDICTEKILDDLDGNQICTSINATCNYNFTMFLRCDCQLEDEFFVFQILPPIDVPDNTTVGAQFNKQSKKNLLPGSKTPTTIKDSKGYIAECRKLDKCVGLRCARMSEVCRDGRCVCNRAAGYVTDPNDENKCKLLNPCELESGEKPLCGEASCLPTWSSSETHDLFKCVCPPGFTSGINKEKNSTVCFLSSEEVCLNPMLNKCQHKCTIDRTHEHWKVKCECFDGYSPGTRPNIDDHLCFFDKDMEFLRGRGFKQRSGGISASFNALVGLNESSSQDPSEQIIPSDMWPSINCLKAIECKENEICIKKADPRGDMACQCTREGYTQTSDGRCVDWCEAAKTNPNLQRELDKYCLSGRCNLKDNSSIEVTQDVHAYTGEDLRDIAMRLRPTKPQFQCNCTTSKLLDFDPEQGTCKLNFEKVIEPCLVGGIGYEDCVQNKSSYCAVLFTSPQKFLTNLTGRDRDDEAEGHSKKKSPDLQKPYTCVCSPGKTLLVDKPRGKAKCVRECDMVNNECVRYNRMCRPANFKPDDYLADINMVNMRHTNAGQFNIEETGCECLPGFTGPPPDSRKDMQADSDEELPDSEGNQHMRINETCLLEYDVIELMARFRAPVDFDPTWLLNEVPGNYSRQQIERFWKSSPTQTPTSGSQKFTSSGSKQKKPNLAVVAAAAGQVKQRKLVDVHNSMEPPEFMWLDDVESLHKSMVLVGNCNGFEISSREFYLDCMRHRYWTIQKLRKHFIDWRTVLAKHFMDTFKLMEGSLNVRVNECRSMIKKSTSRKYNRQIRFESDKWIDVKTGATINLGRFSVSHIDRPILDPTDETELLDADLECNLTLHTTSPSPEKRPAAQPPKVLLEKQLGTFIFEERTSAVYNNSVHREYLLMVPETLIKPEIVEDLPAYKKPFDPCNSSLKYCDRLTTVCQKHQSADTNFSCTCRHGFTPVSSKDIFKSDSRKEVCEDIDECLFDVCKEEANTSSCINQIGDYKCECIEGYIKHRGVCMDICDTIKCDREHGTCSTKESYAICECEEGYIDYDCSKHDPKVALRKANMIILGSIFTSVLLLAITVAISQNKQLKKKKKELQQIKSEQDSYRMYEFSRQRPMKNHVSKRPY